MPNPLLIELLDVLKVKPQGPASPADIEKLALVFGHPIPAELREVWQLTAGFPTNSLDAHFFSPSEILELLNTAGHLADALRKMAALPIVDDHQSNFLALYLDGPLAPRVAHIPHDDSPRLLTRNLDSCLNLLTHAAAVEDDLDSFLRSPRGLGDYSPDGPRDTADQQAASLLLATDGEDFQWNYAIQLLDSENDPAWAKLLETDHFIRRDARDRMQQMNSARIRTLLEKDQIAFEKFASSVRDAATEAGLEVGERQGTSLRIGGRSWELEGFFYRRHIPNALPRLIQYIQDILDEKHPLHRPNHFFADD